MATIKGRWLFKDRGVTANYIWEDVNFTSNGISYTAMVIESYVRFQNSNTGEAVMNYPNTTGWEDQAYRTVDFGDTEQTVTDAFYAALTANASQIVTIKGKWRAPSGYAYIPTYAYAGVNFKSGPDINYCGMRLETNGYISYEKDSGDVSTAYNYDNDYWQMDSYRTVDFGDTEQEVTGDWYEVFTSVYRPLVTIKGKWVLGDTPSEYVSLDEEVNFTADGVLYCCMYHYADSDGKGDTVYYYGTEPVRVRNYSDGWLDSKYKTVDFGENEQYVFEEFYTKFTLVARPMTTTTIKGKWYFFRTDISVGYKTRQKVNFTSEGVPFDTMEFSDDPLEVRYIMDGKWGYSFEGGFLEEEYHPYRTVDFGDTEQTVYEDWYYIFLANATDEVPEQSEPEPEPEPEKPKGVLVTYNGKVIAALKAGQTAQLHIANTEVMHDLFITVPEDIGSLGN